MGIVSRDNVHNVKVTARVRRIMYISIYGYRVTLHCHVSIHDNHIWTSEYVYALNVKVTVRVRHAYTYSDVHIWLSCILT